MPARHTGPVSEIFESSNNKIIATTSLDHTIKIWETNSQRLLRTYIGNYQNLFITNDNAFLVADSSGGLSKVWDLLNDSLIKVPSAQFPLKIAVSPNSKLLAALFADSMNVYDLNSMKLLKSIKKRSNKNCSPSFSMDNMFLLYSSTGEAYTSDIELLSTSDFNFKRHIQTTLSIYQLKYISDSSCLVSNYSQLRVINLRSGNVKLTTPQLRNLKSFSLLPNSNMLGMISDNSDIHIYSVLTGAVIAEWRSGNDVKTIDFTNTMSEILVAGFGSVAIYNFKERKIVQSFSPKNSYQSIYSARFIDGLNAIAIGITNDLIIADRSFELASFRTFGKKIENIDFEIFDPTSSRIYSRMFSPGEPSNDKIFSISTGKLIDRLRPTDYVIDPFTPDGKYVFQYVQMYSKEPVTLRDASTGTIVKALDTYSPNYGVFSPDRKYYFIPEFNGQTYMRKGNTFEKLYQFNPSPNNVINPVFSHNSKLLALPSDGNIYVYNSESGKLLYTLSSFRDTMIMALFSANDSILVTNSNAGNVSSWNAKTGKKLQSFRNLLNAGDLMESWMLPGSEFFIKPVLDTIFGYNLTSNRIAYKIFTDKVIKFYKVLPDGQIAVVYYNNDSLFLYNSVKGSPNAIIPGKFSTLTALAVSDSSILIAGFDNGRLEFWDLKTNRRENVIFSHGGPVKQIVISPNNKLASTVSDDCSSKIWEIGSSRLVFTFVSIDSSYLFISPDNYYMGKGDIVKKVHFENKLRTIGFEQLDARYNRPDRVLEALNSKDTNLIESYKKAYVKRIKKLNIDTALFSKSYSIPEADFVNRDSIEYKQVNKISTFLIHCIDSTQILDHFNVWVNDVPVYGLKGISIKHKKKNVFDTTVNIVMSPGDNKIETSVTNVSGIESYRNLLNVKCVSTNFEKEKIYFVGIGIDEFANAGYNLQYCSKDIRDLSIKLKQKYGNNLVIDTLFNDNVKVDKIKALKEKLQHTEVNDKVIVAYSGHGLLSRDYDYYLSTYNIDFNYPEKEGLPYDEFEDLLDGIPARKKLMLIDACHSGEIDKEEMGQYVTAKAKPDSTRTATGRGAKLSNKDSSRIGLKNSFELMQELFLNIAKNTGATVISAASGTQFALEKNDLKNGVFTYSILEYMQRYEHATLSELKKYVNARVRELTKGLQVPTSRTETINVDWELW